MENQDNKLKDALKKHNEFSDNQDLEELQPDETPQQKEYQQVERPSFFGTIVGFIKVKILGIADPSYEKYILLKEVANEIKELKLNIYNTRHDRVTKKFGKVLYELYRYIFPLKELINLNQSKVIKSQIKTKFVLSHFNEEQKQLFSTLTGEGLKELLVKKGIKDSTKIINGNYKKLQASLNKETIKNINISYSVLHAINELIRFDLYPLVKKFAPQLEEDNITDPPAFKDVDGNLVVEELKNLCYTIYSIDTSYDLKAPFRILNEIKGSILLSDDDIKNFQNLIKKIISEDYLSLLIKIIDENPFFRPVYNFVEFNITNEFFQNLMFDIKSSRDKIVNKIKDDKVNVILKKLFETTKFQTLKNYNEEKSEYLYKKGVKSFLFVQPLNFIKKFIMELYNKYIMDISNTFLIEGNYMDKKFNQNFSSAFLDANELMQKIKEFDEDFLGDEKVWGRIKTILPNVMRDQKLLVVVNKEVDDINSNALTIIKHSLLTYEQLLRSYRTIVEEYKKNSQDIITNIKTIGGAPGENKNLVENIVKAYNDMQAIYALVKFLIGDR